MKKTIGGLIFEMEPMTSKYVSYLGYDDETGIMAVEFIRGPAYFYEDVPKEVFVRYREEKEPDAFFDAHIKTAFKNRRVG